MLFKDGSIAKISKISGVNLYHYAKGRSNSISSTVSTMNDEQPKSNNAPVNIKTKIPRPESKIEPIAFEAKEETVNFLGKRVNEVKLSTNKPSQMVPSNARPLRNSHFNSGMSALLKASTVNGCILPLKLANNNQMPTPIICKPTEMSKKTFSILNACSSGISKPSNDFINCNTQNTEPNETKELRRCSPSESLYNSSPNTKRKILKHASVDRFKYLSKGLIALNNDIIDIEDLILLEDKYLDILSSIKQHKNCLQECFEWWSYYFDSSLSGEKYDEFFIENQSKIVIHTANNLELFSVLFFYYISEDSSSWKKYNEALHSIFTKLHINFLYVCSHILAQQERSESIWHCKMTAYVRRELISKALADDDFDENSIVAVVKGNCKMIAETIRVILNNYSKQSIFAALNHYFNNLTKLTNGHLRDFFREEVYNAHMQESNKTKKVLKMNHKRNRSVTQAEIKIPYLSYKRTKPYTLVLDLDETLISTKVFTDSEGVVIFRPGLTEFLSTMKNYYELVSFTAATQDYAESVLEMIEEDQKFFDYRLYQNHTVLLDKEYVKDISLLGRDLSTVIIVDNMPHTFKMQKSNGILIKSFYGDKKSDTALIDLQPILIKIAKEKGDVRKSILKYKNSLLNKVSSRLNYLNEENR